MIKYIIKNGEPKAPEPPPVEIGLTYNADGSVSLGIGQWFVMKFLPDGTAERIGYIASDNEEGLAVDSNGRIKVNN